MYVYIIVQNYLSNYQVNNEAHTTYMNAILIDSVSLYFYGFTANWTLTHSSSVWCFVVARPSISCCQKKVIIHSLLQFAAYILVTLYISVRIPTRTSGVRLQVLADCGAWTLFVALCDCDSAMRLL